MVEHPDDEAEAVTARLEADCCVAGGGPAGLMAGMLLARAGCRVIVLEKHKDFLRDFRGDTIHPSTLELMHELGWLEDFLALPHQKVAQLAMQFGETRYRMVDFSHLKVAAPFIAMMPQWDFLNFLDEKAAAYPGYRLLRSTKAVGLLRNGDGRITGVKAEGPEGVIEIEAALTIAADGRGSTLRDEADMQVTELGAPMDAQWFRLSKQAGDSEETFGRVERGQIMILLNRGDYWQCAYVIPKGMDSQVRAEGVAAFRKRIAALVPMEAARLDEISSLDEVKTLTVQVNRLERWWKPGFLCIGDAAHAMSPIGGVGVNLAVQDAVAAANILAAPLREGVVTDELLAAVEARRAPAAKRTQDMQLFVQNNLIEKALKGSGPLRAPWPIRLNSAVPLLRRIPARLIGMGLQPEHISDELRRAAAAQGSKGNG